MDFLPYHYSTLSNLALMELMAQYCDSLIGCVAMIYSFVNYLEITFYYPFHIFRKSDFVVDSIMTVKEAVAVAVVEAVAIGHFLDLRYYFKVCSRV